MKRIKDKSGAVRFVSESTAKRLVDAKEAVIYGDVEERAEVAAKAVDEPVAEKMVKKPTKKKSTKKKSK